jgi:hypothetical protein
MVAEVWRTVHPRETVVTDEDKGMLPPVAIDRVRSHHVDGATVLHMYTNKVAAEPARTATAMA